VPQRRSAGRQHSHMLEQDRGPTVADVAEAAGIARSTVSRAMMNRKQTFSAARIRAVAESLGYEANPSAANLRRQQSHTIGALVSRLADMVKATLYEDIASGCPARGYHAPGRDRLWRSGPRARQRPRDARLARGQAHSHDRGDGVRPLHRAPGAGHPARARPTSLRSQPERDGR
jgi:transcriptional regulator with XRE-family HTH domain